MLWLWDGGTAMPALKIRDDISPAELRRHARRENNGRVSARLIALANALDGMDRASAARLAGMDRQTLRDWVHRYNGEGIAGLCDRPKPGRTPKLTEGQMASLKAVVSGYTRLMALERQLRCRKCGERGKASLDVEFRPRD
jgi:hypothetical protein